MISNDLLVSKIQSNEILIQPSVDVSTVKNGILKLNLDNYGAVLPRPSLDDYNNDPREIIVRIQSEEVPVQIVDLNTYILGYGRTIFVRSLESVTLPSDICAIGHCIYGLVNNVHIKTYIDYVLEPNYEGKVYFAITNPLEFPIILESGKPIVELTFESLKNDRSEMVKFFKKGKLVQDVYIAYSGLDFPEESGALMMDSGVVSRMGLTYNSTFSGTASFIIRKLSNGVWSDLGNVGIDIVSGSGGQVINDGSQYSSNGFKAGDRLGVYVKSKTGNMLKNVTIRVDVAYS